MYEFEGEVYRVNDHLFRMLDDLEWYPHFYQRIEITTDFGDAWLYIVKAELCQGKKLIPGNWRFIC